MVEKMFPLYSQLMMGIARILSILTQILILLMIQVLIKTLIYITICYSVQKVDMMALKDI